MSVTKNTGAEVYSVKNAGEWATIVLRAWDEPSQEGSGRFRGELLINSTFGSWSHYWSAPGMPFKQFLVELEFDYLMGKLMGRDTDEHNGPGIYQALRKRVLSMRRKGRIDKGAAAWLWREMSDRDESLEGSVESFVEACGNILAEAKESWSVEHTRHFMDELGELLEEPWYMTVSRTNPAAQGFWRDIWAEFTKALEDEAVAETETAYERPHG